MQVLSIYVGPHSHTQLPTSVLSASISLAQQRMPQRWSQIVEPNGAEWSRTSRAEPNEPSGAERSRAEPSGAERSRAEPSRAEPSRVGWLHIENPGHALKNKFMNSLRCSCARRRPTYIALHILTLHLHILTLLYLHYMCCFCGPARREWQLFLIQFHTKQLTPLTTKSNLVFSVSLVSD
jgi:hypothetical protein